MNKYILKEKTPVKCDSLIEWVTWFNSKDTNYCIIGKEKKKKVQITTIFLVSDPSYNTDSPRFFKTSVSGGSSDGLSRKYVTWEEARKGHKQVCSLALN